MLSSKRNSPVDKSDHKSHTGEMSWVYFVDFVVVIVCLFCFVVFCSCWFLFLFLFFFFKCVYIEEYSALFNPDHIGCGYTGIFIGRVE